MNTIHFVIKRLANIRKYLEQNIFLGKIALAGDFMPILILSISPDGHHIFCKADNGKK